jgi:hypothetical protein
VVGACDEGVGQGQLHVRLSSPKTQKCHFR